MPTLERGGVAIHYEVHGSGAPVLCMSGWGGFCHGRLREVPRSLVADHQVIAFDWRGLGASGDDPSRPLSMGVLADDAAAVLDAAGCGPTHVVGIYGMGGCVAQELCLARPDLVRSLFLSGCWAHVDALFREHLELLGDVYARAGFPTYQRLAASLSFTADFYEANRHRLLGPDGAWAELADRPATVARFVEACVAHEARDRLAGVDVPTLVLHGALDVLTPVRLTRAIERAIPGARGAEWLDLAHLPAGRDQRQRFDRLVTDFIASAS